MPEHLLNHIYQRMTLNNLHRVAAVSATTRKLSKKHQRGRMYIEVSLAYRPGRTSSEALSILSDLVRFYVPQSALGLLLQHRGLENVRALSTKEDFTSFFNWYIQFIQSVASAEVGYRRRAAFAGQLLECVFDRIKPKIDVLLPNENLYPDLVKAMVETFDNIVTRRSMRRGVSKMMLIFAIAMAYRESNLTNDDGFGNVLLVNIIKALKNKAGDNQKTIDKILNQDLIDEAIQSEWINPRVGHDRKTFTKFVYRISGHV